MEVSRLTENTMKWHDKSEPRIPIALSPKLYSHGDPVWVLRNNTVTYIGKKEYFTTTTYSNLLYFTEEGGLNLYHCRFKVYSR